MQQPVNTSRYSNQRPAGLEHVPLYPKGFIAVRIIQLVLSVICLALSAFAVSYYPLNNAAFMVFVALATMITSIYCIVAHYGAPKIFNYWAVLALDIFLLIFWLISFALMALSAAYFGYYAGRYDDDVAFAGVLAGAAAIGAFEFILYIVSLVIHSVMLYRHRKVGLHNNPVHGSAPAGAAPGVAATNNYTTGHNGAEKIQMQSMPPQQTHEQQPPQQMYPQQQQHSENYGTSQSGYQQTAPVYPQSTGSPAPQQTYPSQFSHEQQHSQNGYSGQQVDHSVVSQTTGGSYVQGQPVPMTGTNQPSGPVFETHGQSYDPHAPKELPN